MLATSTKPTFEEMLINNYSLVCTAVESSKALVSEIDSSNISTEKQKKLIKITKIDLIDTLSAILG